MTASTSRPPHLKWLLLFVAVTGSVAMSLGDRATAYWGIFAIFSACYYLSNVAPFSVRIALVVIVLLFCASLIMVAV